MILAGRTPAPTAGAVSKPQISSRHVIRWFRYSLEIQSAYSTIVNLEFQLPVTHGNTFDQSDTQHQ
jgi:hypothetical protein